jgi:hypothetical protein
MHSLVTTTSSDDSVTETETALAEDQLVQEGSVPTAVDHPSTSNTAASGTLRYDMSAKCSTGISIAVSSEESTTVVKKAVLPDTVPAPVSTSVARVVHHPASGMIHTTATDTAVPSRAMPLRLSTTEVGGIKSKHIHGISIVAPPVEINAEQHALTQHALTKKRKSEDQSSKKKQANDLSPPKKSLTAYMHYSNYACAYIKANQPHLENANLTSVVQRGWNAMTDEQRHYWDERAAVDEERYRRELANYKNCLVEENEEVSSFSNSDANPIKKRRKKQANDPNAPKRNISAYMHYSSSARKQVHASQPDLTPVEITKVVSTRWNGMSDQERAVWKDKAAADKARYQNELARYKDSELALKWQASQVEESTKL